MDSSDLEEEIQSCDVDIKSEPEILINDIWEEGGEKNDNPLFDPINMLANVKAECDTSTEESSNVGKRNTGMHEFEDKGIADYRRFSRAQIDCYLKFVKMFPEIKANRYNKSVSPKRIKFLWQKLSEKLNVLKGPKRTPVKWRESLSHWKNQMRCRARKLKERERSSNAEISTERQRTLDTLSPVVISKQVPSKTEMKLKILQEVQLSTVRGPSIACNKEASAEVTSSTNTYQKKLTSQEMFEKFFEMMTERDERDKRFQEKTLKHLKNIADALNNVARALLAINTSKN